MKTLLTWAGIAEAATGVALLAAPLAVGRLLLGAEPTGVGVPVARVLGLALLSLGVACCSRSALLGMWSYTALATFYFLYLALGTQWIGKLLWPAISLHALLTVLLARPCFSRSKAL